MFLFLKNAFQKKNPSLKNQPLKIHLEVTILTHSFERGASEAAEGCLASVAAKLVKTAIENLFSILARGNKSTAANLGLFFLVFVQQLKSHYFQCTCAWK